MRRLALAVLPLAFLAACQPATTELTDAERAAIRDTVTQLADDLFAAFKALDSDRYMAPFASELVWADAGVLGANRDSLATAWSGILASIQEVTSGGWRDVHLSVLGPNVAVWAAGFDWAGVVDTAGTEMARSGVWTTVWERTAEGWKIVQGHESFLTPPESM